MNIQLRKTFHNTYEINTFDGIFSFDCRSFSETEVTKYYNQIVENKGKVEVKYYDILKSTEIKKEN